LLRFSPEESSDPLLTTREISRSLPAASGRETRSSLMRLSPSRPLVVSRISFTCQFSPPSKKVWLFLDPGHYQFGQRVEAFGRLKGLRAQRSALKEIDYRGMLVAIQNMYFSGKRTTDSLRRDSVQSVRPRIRPNSEPGVGVLLFQFCPGGRR
jgi:hypothetical protein